MVFEEHGLDYQPPETSVVLMATRGEKIWILKESLKYFPNPVSRQEHDGNI